ncbi:MAG: radical SAM family heme chaperone HemW [Rikenellaceae bacterium]|jgi:oxygen-independent coproporphyrinogen-3 oxidase|nr:radical SAM family heme chaperone HemW [Rikenellaceae bacterium]
MAGIYVHIPFCLSRCGYCDFCSSTRLELLERTVEAIVTELGARRGFLPKEPVRTIYIGGGTPSLLAPQQTGRIARRIGELWDCSGLQEFTVEANPDDLTQEYLDGLLAVGADRLSVGVQSFVDRDLRFMGRRHDARKASTAVRRARAAGFGNISVDLIYGVPGMSLGEWRDNIARAVELGVEHISAYHLTIEEGTPFGRKKVEPIDEELSREQFMLLHNELERAGYDHYEISNFARDGRRSLHNSGYWSGERYLGVGPSAHSYNGEERSWSVADVERYLAGGDIYAAERLTPTDRYNEHLMTSLRRREGVDAAEVERLFGDGFAGHFLRTAAELERQGLLERQNGRYVIKFVNFLISDRIIATLFSA